MSHLHRFYLPSDTPDGDTLELPEGEAHHALRVVRLRAGETVELFDGAGRVWQGTFEPTGKRDAVVRVTECWTEGPPAVSCTLLQAALHRGPAIEELLRRATEIGVTRFVFFKAQHSERMIKPDAKWERLLVETCKQCGRNWLPEISTTDDALADVRQHQGATCIAAMTPDARPASAVEVADKLLIIVGPEGDFAPQEVAAFQQAGAQPLSLGPTTYRSEVAAVLAATLLLQRAGAFG